MLGRVYKIVDLLSDDVYVGSTFRELSVRFGKHTAGSPTAIGKLMKEHGRSRYSIILIREYQVADKYQLHAYEQLWINKTKCINKQSAFCVKHLYRISIKDHIKEYQRAYYEDNKDKINQKHREYNAINKDKISQKRREYNEDNKDKRREYREANKDKIRDYMISYRTRYREANRDKLNEIDRLYREANREKIKEKQNQKIDCECAGSFTRANKAKHFKTKQHLAWLESKK